MPFDYKKEYKEFYFPAKQPHIINIPAMNYLAVRGHGNPNLEDGEYKQSIALLYAIAFTLKMSKKTDYQIKGYFDYIVPPLEGLWWQDGQTQGIDYANKAQFNFISMIRLPDFVTRTDFNWAIQTAIAKEARSAQNSSNQATKDFSKVEFFTYADELCVQCMHLGSYDSEPATIQAMSQYATEQGYALDIQNPRYHHEIYLSDPRRCQADKLKTVIRHPLHPMT